MKRSAWLFIILLLHTAGFTQPSDGLQEVVNNAQSALTDTTQHAEVDPRELETTVQYQAEPVTAQDLDETKWTEIIGDTDYTEESVKPPEIPNISMPWAGPALKVIGYVVAISLVVFLLYYLARNLTIGPKVTRNKIQTDEVSEPVDNIEEIDIEALLEQARREGDFKMAVRLYYLGLLKNLNELGKIEWKKDKTNRDYLGELSLNNFYFREIRALTLSYEAVWYGEHAIENGSFDRIRKRFEDVFEMIKNNRAA